MAHVEKYQASTLGRMCGHYERSAEKHGYSRENIDNSRTHLNYNLAPKHESQVEFIKCRIESLNLKRIRKDAVRMCDWVITQPQDLPVEESRAFFESVYRHLAQNYGQQNVVSAYVHMDESQPHLHFAFVPVTEDGRLSAKDVLNRNHLKSFHKTLQAAVERDLGHEVGITLEDGQKAAEYVSLPEYKAAKEETDKAKERLELLRQEEKRVTEEIAKLQPAAETLGESAKVIANSRGAGTREKELRGACESLRERAEELERGNGELRRLCEEKARVLEQEDNAFRRRFSEVKATIIELIQRVRSLPADLSRWTESRINKFGLGYKRITEPATYETPSLENTFSRLSDLSQHIGSNSPSRLSERERER